MKPVNLKNEDVQFRLAKLPKLLYVAIEEAQKHFNDGEMGVGLAMLINDIKYLLVDFGYDY
jgi:hypothetical protein